MSTSLDQNSQRLYADLTWLFPIISPPKDYITEAIEFAGAIRQYSRIPVQTLLDLGCGAGHNDYTLKKYFRVTGVDLSQAMLGLARRLNPEVEYLVGDMRTLHLERTFDAVIVADSIDYMLTEDELLAAFHTAYEHLCPGGVFCTYAEETVERFEQNSTFTSTHRKNDVDVALIHNFYDPDPNDTTYEMTFIYLIRQAGNLHIETDHHIAGIFPQTTWKRLLSEAGFDVHQAWFEEGNAPFFIGVKPELD